MMVIDDKARKLFVAVENFIEKHQITTPEAIYQNDDISLNSFEFLEELCDIMGYKEINDEEDSSSTISNYFHS